MSIDQEKVKKLISLVEQNQLTELAVEEDGLSITVKAERSVCTPPIYLSQGQHGVSIEDMHVEICDESPECEEDDTENASLVSATSPMVGVFYRSPSPDSPPYAEVGDYVELGQAIGMIEAMKVFSDVPAEAAGRIVSLPVESGKLVQEGDVLVVIDISYAGQDHSGGSL